MADSRHTADDRLVSALKTRMRNGTRGYSLAFAAYRKAMSAMGYTYAQTHQGWVDCFDIAELEVMCERDAARLAA